MINKSKPLNFITEYETPQKEFIPNIYDYNDFYKFNRYAFDWVFDIIDRKNYNFVSEVPLESEEKFFYLIPFGATFAFLDNIFLKNISKKYLDMIRNYNHVYLVLWNPIERISPKIEWVHEKINYYLEETGIPKNKLIYVTGDLSTHYCDFSVRSFMIFDAIQFNNIKKDKDLIIGEKRPILEHKNYDYVHLIRKSREHRIKLLYKLFKSKKTSNLYTNFGKKYTENFLNDFLNEDYLDQFLDNLEVNKFHETNNNPFCINQEFLTQARFHVVHESIGDKFNFLTEKTFKPIFIKQPFIINGSLEVNKSLKNYGYEIFENIFNYDFDYESNPDKRIELLANELNNVLERYDKKEFNKKIIECNEICEYNYKVLEKRSNPDNVFQRIKNILY